MTPSVNLSFLHLITTADPIVKCVITVLLLSSFIVWAILFDKLIKFRDLKHSADAFEKKFWDASDWIQLYENYKNKIKHPTSKIFCIAMQQWVDAYQRQAEHKTPSTWNHSGLCQRITLSLETAVAKIEDDVSGNLEIVSMIASVSPFVGLFGTVWGIINSFKAIASAGNVGLQVVAPGIAEALITTAIGILVAVIALCLHSVLRAKVNNFINRMEHFKGEMINLISREVDYNNPKD